MKCDKADFECYGWLDMENHRYRIIFLSPVCISWIRTPNVSRYMNWFPIVVFKNIFLVNKS